MSGPYNPSQPFTITLTTAAQSLAALAAAAGITLPDQVKGLILAAPTASTNAGLVYYGNVAAQKLSIPASETVGVALEFGFGDALYLKAATNGDKLDVQPIV